LEKTLTIIEPTTLPKGMESFSVPSIIQEAGPEAFRRFLEFFTAQIRNRNTREAYARAVSQFFGWLEAQGIVRLMDIQPVHIAAWVEMKTQSQNPQTVKQHLAAVKKIFDWLVIGQIVPSNPATVVKGPRYSYTKGKTPILLATDARRFLESFASDSISDLRDRALIALMTYTFARISAALAMNVKDVFPQHHRLWVRLHEKGGKYLEMPCHHNLELYLKEYMEAAGIEDDPKGPLFRQLNGGRKPETQELTRSRLHRTEALLMIKRRARKAGIENSGMCNHSFRGTGITAYLSNPEAKLEHAQTMAGHADPKTTRIYDRRSEVLSLDEVERIGI